MSDINTWLEIHGLQKYADVFAAHEIELIDVGELTDADLTSLGLPLGPRRRFLKAARVQSGASAPVFSGQSGGSITAERRQLTVMFVDLVGSTALSEQLDPEDLAEVMQLYKETCAAAVAEYDGHVASYLGDGVLVFFGFPHAHEDDAARAIHAGLKIIERVPLIQTHATLDVRVGIATGLVVVGDLRGGQMVEDGTAMGETPNLAARLQSMAEPGTLIVAPATRQLAGDSFDYVERGSFKPRGFSKEVCAWQVKSAREVDSRFMAAERTTLNPLVGRGTDYSTLHATWQKARGGTGQVVLVSGEAGIGKSRLIEELRLQIGNEPHRQLRFQCSPYHEASALYPVIRHLERAAGLRPDDTDDDKLRKLAAVLDPSSDGDLKLAASLLSIPFQDRLGSLDLSAQEVMEQTLDMLIGQLVNLSHEKPVLLLFEDAHWIDPTTKSLLDRVVAQIENAPVLIVVTFRPQFDPGWPLGANLINLPLLQLDFEQVRAIVSEMTKGKPVPFKICELIAARTNGVPLYVEEVTKDLLESDLLTEQEDGFFLKGPLPPLAVPSVLQDSLMARLDRLGSAKEVAQVGSVFGPHFSYPMLAAITGTTDGSLRGQLEQLIEAGIISMSRSEPVEIFSYRHALIRDTAYNSLLKSERQSLHARVAYALRQGQQHSIDTGPEILAHHYSLAQMAEEAIEFWHLAGRRAVERSANSEAAVSLAKAVEQLATVEAGAGRDRKEIEIQVLRAGVLRTTAGIAAEETGRVYARIRDLCHRIGETEHLFPVLNGLYAFYLVRAEYDLAREVSEQLLTLARQTGETHHEMVAKRAMGAVLLHVGELRAAHGYLQQALSLYDAKAHGKLAYIYGTDHAAITSSFLSTTLWLLGEPDHALDVQVDAVAAAHKLDHAHSIAQSLTFLCMLNVLRRDVDATRQAASRLAKLSSAHSFTFMSLTAHFWECWADVCDAPEPARINRLLEAGHAWQSAGAGNYKPFFLTLLAEFKLNAGDTEGARELIAEARFHQERTNERWFQADTERVHALIVATQRPAGAEFGAAMETALAQEAHMLALRIGVDCHRFYDHLPDVNMPDLPTLIAQVMEGAETKDLRTAKNLIEARRIA